MEYRFEAASPDGFVSQVIRYVSTGHVFYFTGQLPKGRDPSELDRKLLRLYGVCVPPWTRSRRRKVGHASVHYLRHEDRFVLLATQGRGPFFEQLGGGRDGEPQFRDIRRTRLEFDAYAIRSTVCRESRVRNGVRVPSPRRRVLVRLSRETYFTLRAHLLDQATRHPRGRLEEMIWSLGFYPYRPVLEQLWAIVRAVNRERRRVGLQPLEARRCVQRRKRPIVVFCGKVKAQAQ
jgi:hypothetical protein